MKRKLLSILTALALCLSLLPATAFAAEGAITVADLKDLLEAFQRASQGETVSVQLGKDIDVRTNQFKLTNGSLTLDLNGHKLNGTVNETSGGLFHVDGGGILEPQGWTTRAQAAQMLKNFLEK